jgi:thiamine-phosphate pyrophosphorylase
MADLPRLLLVADGFVSGRPELPAETVAERTVALVEAGVPWVSLRDTGADASTFAARAASLAAQLRAVRPDVLLSVHARLDVARALGAGFHAGSRGAAVADAAGLWPVGFSAHSATQAVVAARAGAHYVSFSPVFETRTHPDAAPAGLDALRRCAERAGVPVLALGGMTPPRARLARIAGAHGAAAIASLLFAWDAPATVASFHRSLA